MDALSAAADFALRSVLILPRRAGRGQGERARKDRRSHFFALSSQKETQRAIAAVDGEPTASIAFKQKERLPFCQKEAVW